MPPESRYIGRIIFGDLWRKCLQQPELLEPERIQNLVVPEHIGPWSVASLESSAVARPTVFVDSASNFGRTAIAVRVANSSNSGLANSSSCAV